MPKENISANQKLLSKHRVFFTISMAILVLLAAAIAIFYARGFKPDFKNRTIGRTGLIVATSVPTGAQIYLDGRLTSATNDNITYLDPKTYKVKIEKDGYAAWEKDVEIKADLATEIIALLFPLAPEIKPLSITGATSPGLSQDGAKIAYGVGGERGGLYLIPMGSGPFSFRQGTKLLAKNSPAFDFSKASFLWSPDSKEIIAKFTDSSGTVTANLLVDSEKSGQEPKDITASLLSTISNWQQQIDFQTQNLSVLAPDSVKDATAEAKVVVGSPLTVNSKSQLAKDTVNREPSTNNLLNYHPTGLMFSPDENKILYMHKDGKYRVYDIGEKKEFTLPEFSDFINISWYPDSNHLVVAQKDIISVIETDGTNKMTIYSGKFENGFVFAHPSGERLIILTTLTQPEGTPTNLYSINLK